MRRLTGREFGIYRPTTLPPARRRPKEVTVGSSEPPGAEGSSPAQSGSPGHRDCPGCGNGVPAAARVCRFCGYEFETGRRPDTWVPLPEYGQPPAGLGEQDPLGASTPAMDPLAPAPSGPEAGQGPVASGLPPGFPQPPTLQRPAVGNNGQAIASLVLGILWLWGVGSILAIVLGYGAKAQIDRSGGTQSGRGLAIAGIVLGWIGVAGTILVLLLFVAATRTVESL